MLWILKAERSSGLGWPNGMLAVALGAVSVILCNGVGCSECSDGEARCVGQRPEVCFCDTFCNFSGHQPCDEGEMCHAHGGDARCVLPKPCPEGSPQGQNFCDENASNYCFGDYVESVLPCPEGRLCNDTDAGALCIDQNPPEPCEAGTYRCLNSFSYEYCPSDSWARGICPSGWTCEDTRPLLNMVPCFPPVDGGVSGTSDAG